MEDDFVGAIKIKDGLFIGDEYAAQDFEFVVTNKVTHIINCAGKQVPNYWETVGVVYLTYDWMDSENQIVFDTKGEVVNQIYEFIEEAAHMGEGVLVHSLKGQSRSCCVLTAYFMKRYRWSLYKTLEFLTSRRSDLEIRTSFYHQLLNLESRLFQQMEGQVTANWFDVGTHDDHEEQLLRNTFLNARSAPFDEALVNPQLNANDLKSRTINWGDEKPTANKTGNLAWYFNEKHTGTKNNKSATTSVKSILKGSLNAAKTVKTKHKSSVEEEPSSSKPTPGMRMHKSVRNLSEARSGSEAPLDDPSAVTGTGQEVAVKSTKSSNMQRSSSACYFEREEALGKSVPNPKVAFAANEKGQPAEKGAAGTTGPNGNVIHVTVYNYVSPGANVNSVVQPANNVNAPATGSQVASEKTTSKPNSASQGQIPKAMGTKFNLTSEPRNNEITESISTKSAVHSSQVPGMSISETPNKSTLSTNQLKSAIEKKLSKEFKSQMLTPSTKHDFHTGPIKASFNDKIIPEPKKTTKSQDYSRPTDIKVNYNVLLKSRDTPPPRKREEAKKVQDSPHKKALSKSSVSNSKTPGGDSGLPYSSYLNSLFSTSFSHLNTITPSAYNQPFSSTEKKTPASTKSSGGSYNLTLSQKAQSLTRPQRASTANSQSNESGNTKVFSSSMIASTTSKPKNVYNDPPSTNALTAKYNNYMTQGKSNPVRITYDKADNRPQSATPDRSATPQGGLRRIGTPTTSIGFTTKTIQPVEQRLSAPSKNAKHSKKDSGSTQELLAKYRQRSSSPSQMGYNPVLSSSMNLKSKKY